MVDPGKIEIEPDHAATELVDQQVFLVTDKEKFPLLYNILKAATGVGSVLIFTNRRDQTERLADALYRYGIDCEILSGAVAQNKRQRILADFKEGRCKIVVATDVAGRGIHVNDITQSAKLLHLFLSELLVIPETGFADLCLQLFYP